jgi:hypothetical protein
MRRRLLLLALLAGGLTTAGGAALGNAAASGHDARFPTTALARAELADVPAPTALSRARDGLGREHDTRRDVTAALGVALVLTLAGGWWLARERAARVRHALPLTIRRTRAPPGMPHTVRCC